MYNTNKLNMHEKLNQSIVQPVQFLLETVATRGPLLVLDPSVYVGIEDIVHSVGCV